MTMKLMCDMAYNAMSIWAFSLEESGRDDSETILA
jgi:hypothetical protein